MLLLCCSLAWIAWAMASNSANSARSAGASAASRCARAIATLEAAKTTAAATAQAAAAGRQRRRTKSSTAAKRQSGTPTWNMVSNWWAGYATDPEANPAQPKPASVKAAGGALGPRKSRRPANAPNVAAKPAQNNHRAPESRHANSSKSAPPDNAKGTVATPTRWNCHFRNPGN